VAVEIVSDSDAPEPSLDEKLTRYRRLGVRELVRFDPQAPAGTRLRAWDRVEGDLIEREVTDEHTPSLVLALVWVVAPGEGHGAMLRIIDPQDQRLVLTRLEARKAAEARIAELEAELRRRG
jgi:Uma2 family endonuclease